MDLKKGDLVRTVAKVEKIHASDKGFATNTRSREMVNPSSIKRIEQSNRHQKADPVPGEGETIVSTDRG